jgi:hypothetical protein
VVIGRQEYRVNIRWAQANLQRLPDSCTETQMREAMVLAHPAMLRPGAKEA